MSEHQRAPRRPWAAAVLSLLALGVLAAVFSAYLNPHLALDLATRVWNCV